MSDFNDYLNKAKDLAEDASEGAKDLAGEVVSKVKELTDDGKKVKELKETAKEQAYSLTSGAKEKLHGLFQDAGAAREIKQGIDELEDLPEFEGSILYSMELQALVSDLKRLDLIIDDDRMDATSVVEEIQRVMDKVQPSDPDEEATEEQQAIECAKAIAYGACERAKELILA